jgi:hypothetical protein
MSTKRPEAPVQEDSDGSDDDGPMPMPEGEEVKEAGLKRKKKRLIHEKVCLSDFLFPTSSRLNLVGMVLLKHSFLIE